MSLERNVHDVQRTKLCDRSASLFVLEVVIKLKGIFRTIKTK